MKSFVLREEHLTLLAAMVWEWDDSMGIGAPRVDAKRPFGFSTGIERDILDAVGWLPPDDGETDLAPEDEERARELYAETLTALLVILSARSCRPGGYVQTEDGAWLPMPGRRGRQMRDGGALGWRKMGDAS